MFACLCQPPSPISLFDVTIEPGLLESVAREFPPRVEVHEGGLVTLDIDGLGRLFGTAAEIGQALRCAAADRGAHPHVAIAGTRTAAMLLALGRAGLTVVPWVASATGWLPCRWACCVVCHSSIPAAHRACRKPNVQALFRPCPRAPLLP